MPFQPGVFLFLKILLLLGFPVAPSTPSSMCVFTSHLANAHAHAHTHSPAALSHRYPFLTHRFRSPWARRLPTLRLHTLE